MTDGLRFMPPRVPLVDPRTGMITREWYRLFQTIMDPNVSDDVETFLLLAAQSASASNLEAADYSIASAVNQLPSNVDDLRPSLNDLRQRIETAPTRGNSGETLSRVNDTNITMVLSGTPTAALLAATTLTLGWTGTLAVARGGIGQGVANGTALDNITNFSATGLLTRTGAGAYAFRTITGTANEVTLTNGDGVGGNPTVSLPTSLTFTGKTVTGGVFSAIRATNNFEAYGLGEIMRITTTAARSGGNGYLSFYDTTGRKGFFGFGDVNDDFYIYNECNGPVRVGVNGFQSIYLDTTQIQFPSSTTASAANLYQGANNFPVLRSTSSIRYKANVETVEPRYADKVLELRPVWYQSKCDADNPNYGYWGIIAEEAEKIDPRLVHYAYLESDYEKILISTSTTEQLARFERRLKKGAKMVPDGFQYERVCVLLLDVVKRLEARVATLERLEGQ